MLTNQKARKTLPHSLWFLITQNSVKKSTHINPLFSRLVSSDSQNVTLFNHPTINPQCCESFKKMYLYVEFQEGAFSPTACSIWHIVCPSPLHEYIKTCVEKVYYLFDLSSAWLFYIKRSLLMSCLCSSHRGFSLIHPVGSCVCSVCNLSVEVIESPTWICATSRMRKLWGKRSNSFTLDHVEPWRQK